MGSSSSNNTPLFVFGTLLDHDVATLVCGDSMLQAERCPAILPGFETRYVKDSTAPVLVLARSSRVYGEVVPVKTEFVAKVIEPWKGNYELCSISVKLLKGDDCQCMYFSHTGFSEITGKRWVLDEWRQIHKREYLKQIKAMLH